MAQLCTKLHLKAESTPNLLQDYSQSILSQSFTIEASILYTAQIAWPLLSKKGAKIKRGFGEYSPLALSSNSHPMKKIA
jgi:hypothetical protein